jgi:hypothetical protein
LYPVAEFCEFRHTALQKIRRSFHCGEYVLATLSPRRWFVPLVLLLAAAFSLGPIFEPPDEIQHFDVVRHLALNGRMADPRTQIFSEFHQAPLYYALLAPLYRLIGSDDDLHAVRERVNPHRDHRWWLAGNDNKNTFLHTRAEDFPYRSPTARTVHLLRLISVALGIGTVIVAARIFALIWPGDPAARWLALAIVACWPQFLYVSSAITNDALAVFFGTAGFWRLLIFQERGDRRSALWLGVVIGLALITKVSLLVLLLAALITVAFRRDLSTHALVVFLPTAALGGWWYTRNLIVFGDATLTSVMYQTWPGEAIDPLRVSAVTLLDQIEWLYRRSWARFGNSGFIPAAPWLYTLFDLLIAGTLIGWARSLPVRRSRAAPPYSATLWLYAALWVGVVIGYSLTTRNGSHGRLLLPGIAAYATIISHGLLALIPRQARIAAAPGASLVLCASAITAVLGSYLPAFRPLPPANDPHPVGLRYGEALELVGVSGPTVRGQPGQIVSLNLTWRTLASTDANLRLLLTARDLSSALDRVSYPANGNRLAADLRPGETWRDRIVFAIPVSAPPQTVYFITLDVFDGTPDNVLPVTSRASGSAIPRPAIARLAINAPPGVIDAAYSFAGRFDLAEPRFYEDELCLEWSARQPVTIDYGVRLRGLASDQEVWQRDHQPRDGRYPTGAWGAGEIVAYCVPVDRAASQADTLLIGLYDPLTGDLLGEAARILTPDNG